MRKLSGVLLAGVLTLASGSVVFAATDNGTTSATVDSMISVTAPASIDFGAGVPGDLLTVSDSVVTVISNNAAGYTLAVQASALTDGTDVIPATAMKFRDGAATYASLAAAATDLTLASPSAETDADGTAHLVDAQLVLPFVQSGAYEGTFVFTASNLE
jgi:hypothetical protein